MSLTENTRKHILPNGLRILIHPIEGSRVAALHFCVQAGYFLESDSEVGLAHLLEHMYFKGSDRYPQPGTIGIKMKSLAGVINASTAYDQTNYFCKTPSENILPALDIMADAFAAPIFPADELQKECEVVIEEFNRKLDSPSAFSLEQLIQLSFEQHRMKRWRIGTPEQLRSYTRDDLFHYFHRYYQPQNMVVTLAGDVSESLIEQVEARLGGLKNQEMPKDFGPAEPPQKKLRYEGRQSKATQSFLHMGFHVPGVLGEDSAEIEFLTFILSSGRSSRFNRQVVERSRSASAVSCSYHAYEDIGLLLVGATTQVANIRQASRDIWSVISDLTHLGISAAEIKKTRTKLKLHQALQTEDPLNLAQMLGYYEAYGGYRLLDEYYDKLNSLTEEEILIAARKYLKLENLNVFEYPNEPLQSLSADQYRAMLMGSSIAPEVIFPPVSFGHSGETGSAVSARPPVVIEDKDTTFILQPDPQHRFVSAGLFFQGGRNEEKPDSAGITHLLGRMALKGTPTMKAEQIALRFDELGSTPQFTSSRDFSGFSINALSESFVPSWNLLLECLAEAHFPANELEVEKGKTLSAIRRNKDDNFVRPLQLFNAAFYGKHPYGFPESGYEETVEGFNTSSLLDARDRLFNRDRAIVVVVGDFDPDRLLPQLQRSLAILPAGFSAFSPPGVIERPVSPEEIENRPKKQTAFVIGFPAVSAKDLRVHPYEVLQQILSGMGGRLFINLRSRKSLAYTVHAGLQAHMYSGTFVTYIAGEASKEEEAMAGMWNELERLKQGVTEEEIRNAKNALIGGYTLSTESAAAKVADLANSYILKRPIPFADEFRKRIELITAADVAEIAASTFIRDNSAMAAVRGETGMQEAEKTVLTQT